MKRGDLIRFTRDPMFSEHGVVSPLVRTGILISFEESRPDELRQLARRGRLRMITTEGHEWNPIVFTGDTVEVLS